MLSWRVVSDEPALVPDQPYDCEGVFTGCWMPTEATQELTVVYSSIKQLPFHWSTAPYPRNAAGLAKASSRDGGSTWTKDVAGPFLEGEPADVLVTGFRDPYVAKWPAMARVRGSDTSTLYAVVSGGIQDVGPTSFLYEVASDDSKAWRYLGTLIDVPQRFQPSLKWSGNYGMNWECVNFMTLSAAHLEREVLIIGAEGDVEKQHIKSHTLPAGLPPRTVRTQVWMFGKLTDDGNGARMQYVTGGLLDHGPYYAANSLRDPKTGRRIMYGWIPEEDIPAEMAREKGWNGSLALPRELFLLRIPCVQKALESALSDITSCELVGEEDGSQSLITLGVRPIEEIKRWRTNCRRIENIENIMVGSAIPGKVQPLSWPKQSTWEMEAVISVTEGCESVGFKIQHDRAQNLYTTITFSVINETITVDRSRSTLNTGINKCPDAGPFTLFTFQNGEVEKLRLRIFWDAGVLEVFANDRFALATMVYADSSDTEPGCIGVFMSGERGSTNIDEVSLYDGIGRAWSISLG